MKYIIVLLGFLSFSCKDEIKKDSSQKLFCNNEHYFFRNNPNTILNIDLNQTPEDITTSIIKNNNNINLCEIGITNSKIELASETLEIPYVFRKQGCVSARYNTIDLTINSEGKILFNGELKKFDEFKNEVVSILRRNSNGLNVHLLVELVVYKGLSQQIFNSIIIEFYKGVSIGINEMSEISFKKSFCDLKKEEVDYISSKLDVFFTNPEELVIEN